MIDRKTVLAGALALVLIPGFGFAYNLSEAPSGNVLLGWSPGSFPLPFAFVAATGQSGSDDIAVREDVLNAVRAGFQVWSDVATSTATFTLDFNDASVTNGVLELDAAGINDPANYSPFNNVMGKPQPPTGDGPYNVVVFVESDWARTAQPTDQQGDPLGPGDEGYFPGPYGWGFPTNAVAIAMWSYSPTTRYITGADIYVNGEFFDNTNEGTGIVYQKWETDDWVDQPPVNCSAGWATDGDPDRWDVRNVITHEVGHVLGLAHPPFTWIPSRSEATMWRSASAGETKKRDLDADDINGVTFLYPNPASLAVVPPDETLDGLPTRNLVDGGTTGDDPVTPPTSDTGGGCALAGDGADLGLMALLLMPLAFLLRRRLAPQAVRKDPSMPTRRRELFTFLIAGLLLSALPARASIMRPLDLDGLVQGASAIVVGEVVERSCHWTANRGSIYTLSKVWVRERIKGDDTGELVTVRTLGGRIGDQGVGASLMTVLKPGEEVLLFLAPDAPGRHRVHGSVQGKYGVLRDAVTGKAYVRRDLRETRFLVPGPTGRGAIVSGEVEHEALEDFVARIRSRIR